MFTSLYTSFKENILWVIVGIGILYVAVHLTFAPYLQAQDLHEVKIFTQTGETVSFKAEVVTSVEDRARGLMFRKHLPEDQGMLFLVDQPMVQKFWMKNTYIPLDIIFMDSKDRIVHIDHNRQPHDETGMGPEQPVMSVLEINGGLAKRFNIEVGDKAQF